MQFKKRTLFACSNNNIVRKRSELFAGDWKSKKRLKVVGGKSNGLKIFNFSVLGDKRFVYNWNLDNKSFLIYNCLIKKHRGVKINRHWLMMFTIKFREIIIVTNNLPARVKRWAWFDIKTSTLRAINKLPRPHESLTPSLLCSPEIQNI